MRSSTYLYCLIILVSLLGCVSDTDFEQVDDIAFTPEVTLNLIFFNLNAEEFFNTTTNTPRLTVSDTTALVFLGNTTITGSIQKIEFEFNFTSTIPRTFQADFEFLQNNNAVSYTTSTVVAAGSAANEVATLFVEEVEGQDLDALTNASKVVVRITIPEANADLTGLLNLQSKATYFIEY